ncbi:MAG TPA: ABC transporter permease [Candidatus Hydrogenedentes bacterium]|nr:ABC transporter permease [Candidatus Hydrogenedentota bacterium]
MKYNLRHLVARWKTTLVAGMTFALVVATFIIVMSLARGVEQALTTTGNPLNVIVMRPGVQSEGQSQVSLQTYQTVRNFAGIATDESNQPLAAPEVITLVNKPRAKDGKPSNIQIRGVHPQSFKLRAMVKLVEGRMFTPGLREILVSRKVSERFADLKLGSRPKLGKGVWTVVGVFDAEGTAYDSEIWTDYQELMQEFDRTEYNTVVVRALDRAAAVAIKDLVEEDRRVKLTAKSEALYYQEQTKTAAPIKAFAVFLAAIMSIGASFAGMNTMYSRVANRVREIGTLRMLGFSPFAVLASFILESVLLALCGGVLGCIFAWPMNGLATGTTNFDTFSEVVFYFTITPGLMLEGLVFAVIMGLAGGFLPAWTASRQTVLSAIRQT